MTKSQHMIDEIKANALNSSRTLADTISQDIKHDFIGWTADRVATTKDRKDKTGIWVFDDNSWLRIEGNVIATGTGKWSW